MGESILYQGSGEGSGSEIEGLDCTQACIEVKRSKATRTLWGSQRSSSGSCKC